MRWTEPNVKRSRGGLRDLQFIRWIGFIRHGESYFYGLAHRGWLTKEEQRKLRAAQEQLSEEDESGAEHKRQRGEPPVDRPLTQYAN
jgi:[protein-PII] uridylyltransferase